MMWPENRYLSLILRKHGFSYLDGSMGAKETVIKHLLLGVNDSKR